MTEKNHPSYPRRLVVVFLLCFSGIVITILDGSGRLGMPVFPPAVSILTVAALIAWVIFYSEWSVRHVKCPICSSNCTTWPNGSGEEKRVCCEYCQIIWKLGVGRGRGS